MRINKISFPQIVNVAPIFITDSPVTVTAEVAVKNITPPEVHISGYVDIETFVPDGVDVIIAALRAAEEHDNEEEEIKVQCVGAPRYRITVKSTDYILAEKTLKTAAERCIAVVEGSGGNGSFLRELDNN